MPYCDALLATISLINDLIQDAYPSVKQMTLKALASLLLNLVGLAEGPRNKEAPSSPHCLAIVPHKIKQQSSECAAAAAAAAASTLIETIDQVDWCCVCLSRLKEKDEMRVLPCQHRFHKLCVDKWLMGRRKSCPLCRFSIGGAQDKSQYAELFTEEMVIWFSSFHIAGI